MVPGVFNGSGCEHGRRGLLDLEQERVVLVTPLEHEHVAARADAPDADHLERDVGEPVSLEELRRFSARVAR